MLTGPTDFYESSLNKNIIISQWNEDPVMPSLEYSKNNIENIKRYSNLVDHTFLTTHPNELIKQISKLIKPNGKLFLSTINRNPRSWITAIVGAEYIFKLLPKGTHEFDKFIKPSDLASFVRKGGAELIETKGMFYNPITHKANLNNDLGVNYLMYARKS